MKTKLKSLKLLSFFLAFLLITSSIFAQDRKDKRDYCLTEQLLLESIKNDSELIKKLDRQDQEINSFRKDILPSSIYKAGGHLNRSGSTSNFIIPVVVYIVHENGAENITDVQVISQINKLNSEFDGHGVQFCLATKEGSTPLPGSASNPGIVHVNSALTNHFTTNESGLKALSPLPSDKYLKIWVVKSINFGSGTLGYARFPGSVAPPLEGIVMRYDAFGDVATCQCTNLQPANNQGKVLVHEVGHYLNLYHTFHNGCSGMNASTCNMQGDRVCDTPPVATNNSGCPAAGSINSCNETPDFPDLVNNHMDYTNDICRTSFTTGQDTRMISAINLFRTTLVSNANLVYTDVQCTGGLLASFSANNTNPCSGQAVDFTATVITGATYTWDFGDGTPTVTGNPISHAYATGGLNYNTILTVANGTNSVSQSQEIYVSDCSPITSSQGNWYFYDRAGLDFSSGAPVADDAAWLQGSITSAGSGSQGEACADQSDANGNLLFYTDAIHIWDEGHNLINPLNDIFGSVSTSGGTMILPNPGNTNEYYLFTTSTIGGGPNNNIYKNKGFRYSKVQVSGTAATLTSTLNIPIIPPFGYITGDDGALLTGEGITAIASCDGYWIICHAERFGTRYLLVYELNSSGLTFNSQYNTASNGYYSFLEASPNGEKLVKTTFITSNQTYLYDFNKTTGTISNETQLNSHYAYGTSFSPNSNLLYTAKLGGGLYQYDVTATSPSSTEVLVAPTSLKAMQIGPNGKIYAIAPGGIKLAVIHQPNVLATVSSPNACVYNINGPNLNTAASGYWIHADWGLPNMIDANTANVYSNTFTCSSTSTCLIYNFSPDICTSSYSWDFGDPASTTSNTSILQNPTHTFSGPGIYTVTLNAGGMVITKTITIGLNIDVNGPLKVCLPTNALSNYSAAGAPVGVIYNWSVTGGTISGLNGLNTVDINWTSLPGTLTLTASEPNTNCVATVITTVTTGLNVNVNGPTTVCLSAGGLSNYSVSGAPTGAIYNWSAVGGVFFGLNGLDNIDINWSTLPGTVTAIVTDSIYGCTDTVTVSVTENCDTLSNCNGSAFIKTITCDAIINGNQTYLVDIGLTNPFGTNANFVMTTTPGGIISGIPAVLTPGYNSFTANFTELTSGATDLCIEIVMTSILGEVCNVQICKALPICGPIPCSIQPNFVSNFKNSCSINFVSTSSVPTGVTITGYLWDFGDPASGITNTSTQQNPTHTFSGTGVYIICLTVYGNNGSVDCFEKLCKQVTIKECKPTPCSIKPNYDYKFKDPCTIDFINASSVPVGVNITGYSWDFGDPASGSANTSTLPNPTHSYSGSGVYVICLTVYAENGLVGCYKKICKEITIKGCKPGPCGVKPKFIYTSSKGNPCTLNFTDLSTAAMGYNITNWQWTVNGLIVSTLQNPSYSFPGNGTYLVCLRAIASNGSKACKEEVCIQVTLKNCKPEPCGVKPEFTYTSSKKNPCTLNFTDLSTAAMGYNITNWQWTVNGLIVSTLQNPSYSFPGNGTYLVCLRAVASNGSKACKEEICIQVTLKGCNKHSFPTEKQSLKAWPNPSNGSYFLNVNLNDYDRENINVYNIMGRLVPFTIGREDGMSFIEVESTEKGIYLLSLQKGGETKQIKLVKM